MAYDLFDLVTLDGVFRRQKTLPSFWLQFFNRQINSDTPEIMWDRVFTDDRGLAPFVVPTAKGRPQSLTGYDTVSFKPAYIKLLDPVSPEMHIERLPGEPLGGSFTLEQRRNAVIAELLRRQKVKIDNRFEWLAARAIIDGKVTIKGEDYPEVLVDFRRDAGQTVVLAGGARWSETTGDPLATLKSVRGTVYSNSGTRIRTHVFGADAWDLFNQRVDVKDMMDTRYKGQDTLVNLIPEGLPETTEYIGRIAGLNGAGAIDVYVDSTKYKDEEGNEQFMLDQKTVVGVSAEVQGIRAFGAIMDKRAGYRPLDMFFKNYEEENPSVEYLLAQSAPLMIPKNPNATFSVKVAT